MLRQATLVCMIMLAIVLALQASSGSPSGPLSNDEAKAVFTGMYRACVKAWSARLDDGTSDPRTIGQASFTKCVDIENQLLNLYGADGNADLREELQSVMRGAATDIGSAAVLENRAAKRKGKAR